MSTQSVPRAKILVVEGGGGQPSASEILTSEGYQVDVAADSRTALEKLSVHRYQAMVLDLELPGGEAMEVLHAAGHGEFPLTVIACATTFLVQSVVAAMRQGADDFLQKPLEKQALLSALGSALDRRGPFRELVSLRQMVDVLGTLQDLEKTYSQLRKNLAQLFHAQACSMALLDADRGEIVAQAPVYGSQADNVPKHRFRISESRVSKIILETGAPFLTNDVPRDPLFEPSIAAQGLENLLAAPMRTPAGPIGFIYLINRPGGFSQLDGELLMALGERVAVAIQHAHSFDAAYRESITDPLTQLYNRRFLDARLRQEVERCRRTGRPIGLVFVDLDRFKQINDQYGHPAGNLVLSEVSRIIRQSCRAYDVPARWGGDEFTLLLTDVNPEYLEMITHRITEAIRQTNWGPVGTVTITMGIAVMPQDADSLEGLVKAADEAMYLAKKRGRNTYAFAQELLQSKPASA